MGARSERRGGGAEAAPEGEAEEPEPHGAAEREAPEHPVEGVPLEVVDGAVIGGEAPVIAPEAPEAAAAQHVAGPEAEEQRVPARGVALARGLGSKSETSKTEKPFNI